MRHVLLAACAAAALFAALPAEARGHSTDDDQRVSRRAERPVPPPAECTAAPLAGGTPLGNTRAGGLPSTSPASGRRCDAEAPRSGEPENAGARRYSR
jgi:hypothetical protein